MIYDIVRTVIFSRSGQSGATFTPDFISFFMFVSKEDELYMNITINLHHAVSRFRKVDCGVASAIRA